MWGDNSNGQLGTQLSYQSAAPMKIELKKDNCVDISCGSYHTVCLNSK